MDFAVAMEMQKICTGDMRELTRGQIAGEVIEFDRLTKGFKSDRIERCKAFYNEMLNDNTKKLYDVDMLMEETEAIKKEFSTFLNKYDESDMFRRMYNDIEDFFIAPPFEGLDTIEYGVNEVCVFSILEYFASKELGFDHQQCRGEYRESIASRTYEEVADHWIKVFDDLQNRYSALCNEITGSDALQKQIMMSGIVAVSAIKDQDSFGLDMVQAGAQAKGLEIYEAYSNGTYEADESVLTDNVIKLFEFVNGQINEYKSNQ